MRNHFLLFLTVWRKKRNHMGIVVGCIRSHLSIFLSMVYTPFGDCFVVLGHFEITPNGYILVKKALDAEEKSSFNLTIEAKDEGQPRRSNTVSTPENIGNKNN